MHPAILGTLFLLVTILNSFASRFGYSNIHSGDKDILLPFSVMIFLFFPLLIYLPETHYKFIVFFQREVTVAQIQQDEQQQFPYACLITLISITLCLIMHRLYFFNKSESEEEAIARRASNSPDSQETSRNMTGKTKNIEYNIQSQILKYYLSLAIGLSNIVSAFYITAEKQQKAVQNQLLIFQVFSLIINFAYGYLNAWSAVSKQLNNKLSLFINVGLVIGYLLGLIAENNFILLALPCCTCGLMIYCSTLIGLPSLFSNGQNHTQDKFRYGSIFTSLLLTVIYHPFCYLLRV